MGRGLGSISVRSRPLIARFVDSPKGAGYSEVLLIFVDNAACRGGEIGGTLTRANGLTELLRVTPIAVPGPDRS